MTHQLTLDDAMQMTLFDFLQPQGVKQEEPLQPKSDKPHKLKVGDKIHMRSFGEIRTATITACEGNDKHYFYRTDRGVCYRGEYENNTVESLQAEIEAEKHNWCTMKPENLTKRLTVKYPPRSSDGKVLHAQVGIYNNCMLYCKKSYSYAFLTPFSDEKKLMQAYKECVKEIIAQPHTIIDKELPMETLYMSQTAKAYATAEYTQWHP
jgi:hypothetical protein